MLGHFSISKKGFTLIELLVAISIMAILSAIAVVSYSGITAKARDSQRIKDLEAIKQGLELYRSDIRNYPTMAGFPLNTKQDSLTGASITYLQVPKDSNPAKNYYYQALPLDCDNSTTDKACLSFILCAKKEGTDTAYDLATCGSLPLNSCGTGISCDIGIFSQ